MYLTIATDFGPTDGYAASLRGQLARCIADADIEVVELGHSLHAFDVVAGAFFARRAYSHWPADSAHLLVVDPGVGSGRDVIAALFDFGWMMAPDNGLFHFVSKEQTPQKLLRLKTDDTASVVSTFEARDRMASAIVQLLQDNTEQWEQCQSWQQLTIPEPTVEKHRILGDIIHIDHYGTLISSVQRSHAPVLVDNIEAGKVFVSGRLVGTLRRCYNDVHVGEPIALWNSDGYLEVAVRQGSAQTFFHVERGQKIELLSQLPLIDVDADTSHEVDELD